MYHLLCSEVAAAAGRYEKMIEARDASPHWAKLARMMNLPESAAGRSPADRSVAPFATFRRLSLHRRRGRPSDHAG